MIDFSSFNAVDDMTVSIFCVGLYLEQTLG